MGGFKGKQVIGYRKDMQHKLNAMLGHCSFRARKDEWTDLPEKIYSTRKVEMNKKQKEAYDKMEDEFLYQIANIEEGELSETTAEMVITQMMKLMQISSGFVIDDEGEVQVLGATNPKVEAVKEALEATDGKVIVFAFYRQSVRTLLEALDEYKPCFIASSDLHKEMNRPQREEKNKFNGDDAHRVMVCQIQSGMYGHTLLGSEEKRCSTSIFYENWYDLNARLQAEDRNHRHGQDRAVQYIDLVASDLDKKAIQALQNKQSIAKAVVDHVKEKR
jgi:SNF2 family DNA or RNA helicase